MTYRLGNSLAVIGSNLFVGTDTGVYSTTNNGASFSLSGLAGLYVTNLKTNGNIIFAGTTGSGVYVSTNAGNTWSQTALNNVSIRAFALSGNTLFAGTDSAGIFMTTNNGTTWIQKNQGLGNTYISSLLVSNGYLYAGTNGSSLWKRLLSEIISVNNLSTEVPSAFSLSQNYPNPFNPTTNIKFSILSSPHALDGNLVQLKVYDVMGREVQTLVNEKLNPGTYEASFDGSTLNSGVYFYKLSVGDYTETKRLTLLK
jgi:hypothetical protein